MWRLSVIFLIILINSHFVISDLVDADIIEAISPEVNTEPEISIENDRSQIEGRSYSGAQLWRIPYTGMDYKNAISELQKTYQTNMWNLQMANASNAYVDMFVKQSVVDDAREFLKKSQVPFEVIIEDIQDSIESQNPPLDDIDSWQNRDGHPMTWTAYHRLNDIHLYMDFLAKSYPNLCSVKTIGKSVENRPLKVLRISNGNPTNKAIWIDAGIHAREWISPAAVTYLADNFVANWDSESADIKSIDWYILPVMNPDGYEYTHRNDRLWRKNRRRHTFCVGTDLNRNYGHKWGGQGASRQPCSETFAGSKAFSEPETKAVDDFLKSSAANFKASLSFHSYGQYILYPWGYDRKVPADHQDLDNVAKEAAAAIKNVDGKIYTVGPAGSTLYPAAGGSDDW
ncbi:hypothetical protein PVAND_013746 [Polypedilum vanderplanki]|uniref:Peptidase M14 domain-containing protein n=1 Tax=Polypedilum vanderplanki TaxID=319348 RepID=A0A9J6CR72_POLVA|nr:hypothetical protein PVAND_013746 [Polypedilum vanderplanki]